MGKAPSRGCTGGARHTNVGPARIPAEETRGESIDPRQRTSFFLTGPRRSTETGGRGEQPALSWIESAPTWEIAQGSRISRRYLDALPPLASPRGRQDGGDSLFVRAGLLKIRRCPRPYSPGGILLRNSLAARGAPFWRVVDSRDGTPHLQHQPHPGWLR